MFCGTAYSKRPSKIIGVTGTNGKTSTVSFVSQILSLLGIRAVSIGTLGVVPGLKTDSYHTDIDSPQLTSFDPLSLHRALHQLAEREVQCAAIECTSHGLDQSRLDALDFDAVALTNVTQDHLDYHKTMHQYAAAKTRLFGVLAKNSAVAVFEGGREHVGFSGSNEFCEISIEVAKSRGLQIKFFSLDSGADVCVTRYVQQGNHFILDISINDQLFTNVAFNLVGKIQIKNLLCAIGLILGAYNDIQAEDIVRVIQLIQQVPGRLELVQKYNGANIFVDYCHTPDALEQALASLEGYGSAGDANQQGKARGKIHIVIGCGGERDKGKRRQIGEIAARYDTLIITDDNPRSEDPAEIRREILNGALGGKAEVVEIPDRAEAILYGVNMVKPGDLLLIAGRGHERFQKVNGQNIPFHDGEFVQKCVDDSASVLRLS
ncbi:MAG: UDP-N-acetylmuramoyl-L-alanyl-D-glutamate--2,6-diaminopimelate ligase [Holosporales bacterium]|nr:UDP-N-acetylmuramoyl-L-alanyl-D-glutamate--2,6-diaminopimelate ligase [Holosporales bacterium]